MVCQHQRMKWIGSSRQRSPHTSQVNPNDLPLEQKLLVFSFKFTLPCSSEALPQDTSRQKTMAATKAVIDTVEPPEMIVAPLPIVDITRFTRVTRTWHVIKQLGCYKCALGGVRECAQQQVPRGIRIYAALIDEYCHVQLDLLLRDLVCKTASHGR